MLGSGTNVKKLQRVLGDGERRGIATATRILSAVANRIGAVRHVPAGTPRAPEDAVDGKAHTRSSLLAPLLTLVVMSLLIASVFVEAPTGSVRAALIISVALSAAAAVLALSSRGNEQSSEAPEIDRFQVLGDRLERGIEKLKDLQWELSDNETRYRDLLDSQNDIITRVDMRGRLTFVNRAFCRTFGVEAGSVLGTPFRPEVLRREGGVRALSEPTRRQRFDEQVATADGPRWFSFEQQPISGDDGTVREVQLLGRDITEQRRVQSSLAEARDQAEAANRAKSRFLATMSHEIRTPMNGILGMAGLLSETTLTAEQQSYVEAIDYSAKNLLTIIDEILDLSKIEAGKLEIHPTTFQLDQCLQSVIELMAPRANERRIDLAWRIEPDLPSTVIGDETRLRQILLNLVGNAIKFTDAGGVGVRVRRVESGAPEAVEPEATESVAIEIEVADTGAGIAPEQIHNLFAEFEQVDDALRRKQIGTGLGLAISRRLARAMGGDIEVQSSIGSGSVFRARMLVQVRPDALPAIVAPTNHRPRRILIVSSRVQQPVLMQETLQSLGIPSEIATAETAAAEMEKARAAGEPFDTVIADAEDGPKAIGRLISAARLADGRAPRALLVVDHSGRSQLESFKSVGCDAYLVRPVRPSSLLTQLDLEADTLAGPAAEQMKPASLTRAQQPRLHISRGRSVLLVEDNEINALLARRMSEKAGCVVHHAASGAAALLWCQKQINAGEAIDLVLMDIHMPEMDGFETTRRVRQLFAACSSSAPPIVALTANAFAEDRKQCLDAGLDDYLAKPFDRSEFESLLQKWCAAERTPHDGSLGGFAA